MIKYAALLLLCSAAFASTSSVDYTSYQPGVGAPKNYVKNPGCDKNINNITASEATLTRNTTTPLEGPADCKIDASATGKTFDWVAANTDKILDGKFCEASIEYQGDASLYTLNTLVGGAVASTVTLTNSGSTTNTAVVPFTCASGSTIGLRVASTGDGAAIYIKRAYIGAAKSSPASYVAQGLSTTVSYSGGTPSADSSWVTSVTDNGTGDFTLNFASTGNTMKCGCTSVQSSASISCPLVSSSATTQRFKVVNDAGTAVDENAIVQCSTLQSQQVITPQMQQAFAGVSIAADSAHSFIHTSSSFTKATDTDIVSGDKTHYGTAIITATAGDFGFQVPSVPAGKYMAIASGPLWGFYSGSTTTCAWGISDGGSGNVHSTSSVFTGSSSVLNWPTSPMAIFEYTTPQSNIEYTLWGKNIAGGGSCYSEAANSNFDLYLIPITQSLPMPVLTNSISTKSTAPQRIVQGTFTDAGAVKFAGTGDWSVSKTATGTYTVTFSPAWTSANYSCVATPEQYTSRWKMDDIYTTTQTRFVGRNFSNADIDLPMAFICIGGN